MVDLSKMSDADLEALYEQEKAKVAGPKPAPQWGAGAQELPDGSIVRVGPKGGSTVLRKPVTKPVNALATIPSEAEFRRGEMIIGKAQSMQDRAGFWTTGALGNVLAQKVPGSWAYDLEREGDTVAGNLAFKELQDMKNASPTGASGLGALSEGERKALERIQGAVDVGQSSSQYKRNVKGIRDRAIVVYPGVDAANPIKLPEGKAPGDLPRGAYYFDTQGNVRRNQNGNTGNPIVKPAAGASKGSAKPSLADIFGS